MKQSEILWATEADEWLARNRETLGTRPDPVTDVIQRVGLKPRSVLEIGSSNGWRLAKLRNLLGCYVAGIEPGDKSCAEANRSDVQTYRGAADNLPISGSGLFELVIMGFCLYFCDPCDYLKIAAEADRVLADGGHLIIYDFATPFPFKRKYAHDERIFAYHFDPAKLWLGHPAYQLATSLLNPHNGSCVWLLQKDLNAAFPLVVP